MNGLRRLHIPFRKVQPHRSSLVPGILHAGRNLLRYGYMIRYDDMEGEHE